MAPKQANSTDDGPIARETVEVTVNGQVRQLPPGTTVASLLALLGLVRERVAVERNGEIVPRVAHGEVELCAGDRLEVVSFVGGG